jgi:gliding motility-associated protein GldC
MKKETISLNIGLDENHIPEKISWESSDNGNKNVNPCEAFMLSIWDPKEKNALRIDLWTKEMKMDEMKYFVHQTIATLSDTYLRATDDKEMADEIKKFSHYFADKAELYKQNK